MKPSATFNNVVARRALPLHVRLNFNYFRCRAKCHFARDEEIASFYNFEIPIHSIRHSATFFAYRDTGTVSLL